MSDIRRHINEPFSVNSYESHDSDHKQIYDAVHVFPKKLVDIQVKSFNPFGT